MELISGWPTGPATPSRSSSPALARLSDALYDVYQDDIGEFPIGKAQRAGADVAGAYNGDLFRKTRLLKG